MMQLTMQVSDELAARVKPMRDWLPTVLELSLICFYKFKHRRLFRGLSSATVISIMDIA